MMETETMNPDLRASCPECDAGVTFPRHPLCGEVTRCPGCSAELEVRVTRPIRLELAPEVQEDWGE